MAGGVTQMRTSQAALSVCGSTNLDGADWEPFAREDLPVHADVWEKMSNTGRSWPRTVIDWQARRLTFLGQASLFLAGEVKFAYEEDRSYNGPRNTAADAEGVRRAVTESGAAFFTGHDDQGLFGKRKLSNSKSSRECYYPISPAVLR